MNFCAFYNSIRTRRSRGIVINQSKQYTANKTHAPEPNQYKEIAFSQLKPINLWTRVFKLDKIRFLVLQEICINVWRRVNATYCQCGELTRVYNEFHWYACNNPKGMRALKAQKTYKRTRKCNITPPHPKKRTEKKKKASQSFWMVHVHVCRVLGLINTVLYITTSLFTNICIFIKK